MADTFWQKALPKEDELTRPSKVTGKRYRKSLGMERIIQLDKEEEARQAKQGVSAGIGGRSTAYGKRQATALMEQSNAEIEQANKNASEGTIAHVLHNYVEEPLGNALGAIFGPSKDTRSDLPPGWGKRYNPATGQLEPYKLNPADIESGKKAGETGMAGIAAEMAMGTYTSVRHQLPYEGAILMSPDATPKERVGAALNMTRISAETLLATAGAVENVMHFTGMSRKAAASLVSKAKAGDAAAFQRIESELANHPEFQHPEYQRPITSTEPVPGMSPDITIKGGPTAPSTIAEAVGMSEPGVEFRPRQDPKSGRVLTTEANLDEHLRQSIEEAVARAEPVPPAKTSEGANLGQEKGQGRREALLNQEAGTAESAPPQKTGLANVVQDAEADAGTLSESPRAEGTKKGEAHAAGKKLVESGEVDPETLAREIATGKRTFKDETEVGALIEGKRRILQRVNAAKAKVDELLASGDDAEEAMAEYTRAQADLQEFVNNVQQGKGKWSDIGRALQEGTDVAEGSYEEILAEFKRQGGKVDPKTEKRIADLVAERDALQEQLTAREAEATRRQLGEDIKTRKAPEMKREELNAELETLLKDLSKATAKMSSGIDPEAFIVLGKIVANRVKYGVATVDELIQSVKQVYRDRNLAEPTDEDILRAYAGETKPRAPRPPSMLAEAKRELALIEKRDQLLAGIDPKASPKAKREKSARIAALEDEIAAIQEAKTRAEKEAGTYTPKPRPAGKKPEPMTDAMYRKKLEDQIREMEGGTWKPTTKAERVWSRETERIKAKRDLIADSIRRSIEDAKPKSAWEKAIGFLSLPRSLKASFDLSAAGRQGWLLGIGNPKEMASAFADQIRAMRTAEDARMIYNEQVVNSKNLGLYKKSGLYLTPPEGSLVAREEDFIGNAVLGAWKKGNPFTASERAYVAHLNSLRTRVFDKWVELLTDGSGKADEKALKALAEYINVATGRGQLSPKMAQAMPAAASALWSPRFLISRIQYATGMPFIKAMNNPAARKMIAGEYAKAIIGTGALVTLGKVVSGDSVGPGASNSDFGKIRAGKTHIDLWAGLQQPIVLGYRLMTGDYSTAKGKHSNIYEPKGPNEPDYTDVLKRFAESKSNPIYGAYKELRTGKDFVGRDVSKPRAIVNAFVPLSPAEIVDAMVKDGVQGEDALLLMGMFGFGVSQYDDAPAKPKANTGPKLPHPKKPKGPG